MADDSFMLSLGAMVLAGVAVLAVLYLISQQQQDSGGQAQMTTYNVVRDDEGRIKSVDTLAGLPLDGQQQAQGRTMQRPQAPEIGPAAGN